MAKKKAELEADWDIYRAQLAAAGRAQAAGMFQEVVRQSLASLPYVDGMMEFGRKYEDMEFRSIATIDHILRYSPLLFDQAALVTLEQTLKTQKRIDKNATDDLAARLTTAYREMWMNHSLWTHLEQSAEARQDELRLTLGGEQDYWRWVCESWDCMGLANRVPSGGSYIVSLKTRAAQLVRAKCSTCGECQEAPKAMFFEEIVCPECKAISTFVILAA